MQNTARQTRENRTITVDFQHEATYCQLLGDGKAFVEFVLAFILSCGFQLKHKAMCRDGGGLTRHSHYLRVRLGGGDHLASPVHDVSCGVHRAAAFRLALSPDATGGRARCPLGHPWRPELRAVRGALSYLAHGALSPRLCLRPPQPRLGLGPVWP